jgi:hypothetical protein
MAKETKSEALHKHLGNNIGYCTKCEKKHAKGKHDPGATKEEHKKGEREVEETERDEEKE